MFTGDTLFVAGCGRFFEGTAEQMTHALTDTLGSLPDETQVYCGHEYTRANLKFAASVDKDNQDLQMFVKDTHEKTCTVPSSIKTEKLINPFMRVKDQKLQHMLGCTDAVSTMQKLRDIKNNFK